MSRVLLCNKVTMSNVRKLDVYKANKSEDRIWVVFSIKKFLIFKQINV